MIRTYVIESQQLVASQIVSAAAAALELLEGFNDSAAAVYVQVFDSSTVPAAATPHPVYELKVNPNGTYSWAPAKPRNFLHGIAVVASSTPNTYTPIVAPSIWVDAEGYTL